MVKVNILGCGGGIGSGFQTTAVLVNDSVLLDAGTGVSSLSCGEMAKIKNVLLTHSHLDHVASLPFLADQDQEMQGESMRVFCLPETADALRAHLLNGMMWPDLEAIEINGKPWLVFETLSPFQRFAANGCNFTALPVEHAVPTLAYAIHGEHSDMVYVADMFDAPDSFWDWLASQKRLRYLVLEAAFPDEMLRVAELSRHLTPALLADRLQKVPKGLEIYAAHLKSNYAEKVAAQLQRQFSGGEVQVLTAGRVFEL